MLWTKCLTNWMIVALLFAIPSITKCIILPKDIQKREDIYTFIRDMITEDANSTSVILTLLHSYCQVNFAIFCIGIIFTGIFLHSLLRKEELGRKYVIKFLLGFCIFVALLDSVACNPFIILAIPILFIVRHYEAIAKKLHEWSLKCRFEGVDDTDQSGDPVIDKNEILNRIDIKALEDDESASDWHLVPLSTKSDPSTESSKAVRKARPNYFDTSDDDDVTDETSILNISTTKSYGTC